MDFEGPTSEPIWLEPFPDELLPEAGADLEARYSADESITLAFLVALQLLPPRQRAALIMRDVLEFSAKEVANSLALTVSAVNSALHRARVTLAKHYPSGGREASPGPPTDDVLRAALGEYMHAWETADVGRLVTLLKEDALLTMPPSPSWYQGREAVGAFMANRPFSGAALGRWRLQPRRANRQPAFELFLFDPAAGAYESVGLQVLRFDEAELPSCIFS